MTNGPDKNANQNWTPDKYIQILKNALDGYEKEHPHWQIEVLVSFIKSGLRSLKYYIEEAHDAKITWDNPFVELHYPVDWNWETSRIAENTDQVHSGILFGHLTKENTCDKKYAHHHYSHRNHRSLWRARRARRGHARH